MCLDFPLPFLILLFYFAFHFLYLLSCSRLLFISMQQLWERERRIFPKRWSKIKFFFVFHLHLLEIQFIGAMCVTHEINFFLMFTIKIVFVFLFSVKHWEHVCKMITKCRSHIFSWISTSTMYRFADSF